MRAEERTFVAVKPDGVQRGLVGEVIKRLETKGYKIVAMKMLQATDAQAKAHYEEHKDKPHMSAAVDAADHTGCHCKKDIGNIFRVTGNSTIPTEGKDARKAQGTCH